MTIDDDNSVYVGGLPYDATEDSLRRVFDLYGSIVAVKIINDRGVGGKCYGFVTFTNPRSAIDAINDMNGRTIAGRVVRVNEVKTRGGRPNFGGENFRRNLDRGVDRDRGRDRDGEYDRDRDLYLDRIRDVSRDRDQDRIRDVSRDRDRDLIRDVSRDRDRDLIRDMSRIRDVSRDRDRDLIRDVSRDRDQDREREFGYARDHDQTRDRFVDRDRDRGQDRELEDNELKHERKRDREWERELELDRGRDRDLKGTIDDYKSGDSDKDQTSKKRNGISNDRHSRDVSSGSSGYDHDEVNAGPADPKVNKRLEMSNQRLEELQNEISHMEELAQEKRQLVSKLQEKSEKLQDALAAAKKLSSHHHIQLTKLHKCYLHVKDYSEKLKGCELQLQSLVDTTMIEVDVGNDVGF